MKNELKQLKVILNRHQKIKLLLLSILLFIGMILEVFGLGLVFPVLSIIEDPNKIYNFYFLGFLFEFFRRFNEKELVYLLLVSILLLYLIKSIFLIILNFKQNRFIFNLSATISNNLLTGYLSMSYINIIDNEISDLYKNIKVEVVHFNNYCQSFLNLITESLLMLSVIFTLFIIEPFGALLLAVFFLFLSSIYYFFTKKKLIYWGRLREKLDKSTSKTILDGLSGIKELKLLRKIKYYSDRFSNDNFLYARVSSNHATISQLPRYYLELSSIFGLVLFLIVLLNKDQLQESIIATLGVFVAATFRLLPSVNKVLLSVQNLKYYKTSVNVLYNEIINSSLNSNFQITPKLNISDFQYLELKNVSFSYPKALNKTLDCVDLIIKKGETIGIIGESGSGKTTLVNILSGLITPDSGRVVVNGLDLREINDSWLKLLSYVSQDVFLINDTIKQNLVLGQEKEGILDESLVSILKEVQLESLILNSKDGINTTIGERGLQISGGQRQRIGLARALFREFSFLILDEPTSALDGKTEIEIMDAVKNIISEEKTLIIISHNKSLLKNCNKLLELSRGKLKQL